MTKLMNRTEIKEEAQRLLLNDGAGAFLHLTEDVIERLEKQQEEMFSTRDWSGLMELANAQAVIAEMDTQFKRMKKFFLFEEFQSNH